jgi:hypothetical protein
MEFSTRGILSIEEGYVQLVLDPKYPGKKQTFTHNTMGKVGP